jgi:uncharacterized repeat protein (TIGR01451 family)
MGTYTDNCTPEDIKVLPFSREVFGVEDMKKPVRVTVSVTDGSNNTTTKYIWVVLTDEAVRTTTITKAVQGPNEVNEGDIVTFVITVTNTEGGDLNLTVEDNLPEGLELLEVLDADNYAEDGRNVTISLGSLQEYASVEYRIKVRAVTAGTYTNHAHLYRSQKAYYVDHAQCGLTVLKPDVALTAQVHESDYISKSATGVYSVTGDYRLALRLKSNNSAPVERLQVDIAYDPQSQRFNGSPGDVKDNGNGTLTWTIHDFGNSEGHSEEETELMFIPLRAITYTFVGEIITAIPGEEAADNRVTVSVNQAIVSVPNVLTAEHPDLRIKDLDNEAIEEVSIRVVNIWGNQVTYRQHFTGSATGVSAKDFSRGTYWYELTIFYNDKKKYIIRDYIEVLK